MTDDAVFDDFPKISDQTNVPEHFPRISEDVRRLPKTFEEDPKMSRWYTNEFRDRDKLDISEIIDFFLCEDIVLFLSICYHSVYTDFYIIRYDVQPYTLLGTGR